MQTFDAFDLPTGLVQTLTAMGFTAPTPIQAAAIPVALEGMDILGTAQTGTGKTAAFGVPLITRLLKTDDDIALVLTPTRELAAQVMTALRKMVGPNSGIRSALLIGGEAMPRQLQQLKNGPRLIVGTPGRINDHLKRKSLCLAKTRFLVLDETDRMLDMGFGVQIDAILAHMTEPRQTLLFSATLPANILKLSAGYMKDPVRISIGSVNAPAARVRQETFEMTESEKYDILLREIGRRDGSIIVFVKTKWGADKMAKKLRGLRHEADAIHGALRQNQRDRVIRDFRDRRCRILVATDIAARGLDIQHIEHVINYDPPQCPEDFIHRIGRTARAGATGEAVNFVTPEDGKKWQAIHRLLNPNERAERKAPGGRGRTGNGRGNGVSPGADKAAMHRRRRSSGGKRRPMAQAS